MENNTKWDRDPKLQEVIDRFARERAGKERSSKRCQHRDTGIMSTGSHSNYEEFLGCKTCGCRLSISEYDEIMKRHRAEKEQGK